MRDSAGRNTSAAPIASSHARGAVMKKADFGSISNQIRLTPKPMITIAVTAAAAKILLRPDATTNRSSGQTM
jgi:hypothetical protein